MELEIGGMDLLGCVAGLSWAVPQEWEGCQPPACQWLGREMLPAFLLHTFFATAPRMALLVLGVRSVWLHVPAALAAGLADPLAPLSLRG